jgi:hypothetical protein
MAIEQEALPATCPVEPCGQVLSSAIRTVLPDQRIARFLDELRGIELGAHPLVVEEALQYLLRRCLISAWRNGYAIRPDQLLQQPLQVALEWVDKPAHIMRCSAGHWGAPDGFLIRKHAGNTSDGLD